MLIKKMLWLVVILCLVGLSVPSFSANPEPPRNTLIITQEFKNVVDNSWSNLDFPKNVQPPGLYYIELSDLVGTVGCWGSKKDPYPDGPNKEVLTAWRDDVPLESGKADFRLQYRLSKTNVWVELIVIAPQAAIMDTWFPFGLQEAKKNIGQTFLALDSFTGIGLQTPTWNTANSG
ncbi:TPA: hypothetical protein ENX78_12160, partial [Candidatus Poribacteria bacterium]|nr:hypothetical protein [Candidatus Poribacteria bacterium]